MKKLFALLLAVAMLPTVAFAAPYAPGTSTDASGADLLNPDQSVLLLTATQVNSGLRSYDLSTDNFTVSKKKIKKGANLVKEIKINDTDNQLVIVLNSDYTLTRPGATKAPNLIIDEIGVKAKKDIKINGSVVVARNFEKIYTGNLTFKVGYEESKRTLGTHTTYLPDVMNKISDVDDSDSKVYDTFTYTDGDVYLEGRAYDGDKVYIEVANEANKDLLKEYPDADLSFVQVITSGLPSSHTINLTADEDKFVYKVVDGKQLAASGLKWNNDDYAWVGKIRSDVSYVISDVELKAAAAEGTTGNPDTGANDVVGIAAALAVVSLVAAGAVSLKK